MPETTVFDQLPNECYNFLLFVLGECKMSERYLCTIGISGRKINFITEEDKPLRVVFWFKYEFRGQFCILAVMV